MIMTHSVAVFVPILPQETRTAMFLYTKNIYEATSKLIFLSWFHSFYVTHETRAHICVYITFLIVIRWYFVCKIADDKQFGNCR